MMLVPIILVFRQKLDWFVKKKLGLISAKKLNFQGWRENEIYYENPILTSFPTKSFYIKGEVKVTKQKQLDSMILTQN